MELWIQLREHTEFIWEYTGILWGMGIASVIMFLGGVIAVPLILARLPRDYFLQFEDRPYLSRLPQGKQIVLLLVKNTVGTICLIAGLIMLILPGQGLLTIIVGLTLMNFPGKHRLLRRILCNPMVQQFLNWIRHRLGKPSFLYPEPEQGRG